MFVGLVIVGASATSVAGEPLGDVEGVEAGARRARARSACAGRSRRELEAEGERDEARGGGEQAGEEIEHEADLGSVGGRSWRAWRIWERGGGRGKRGSTGPTKFARIYIGLGRSDEAVDWNEQGYDCHNGDTTRLDPLRHQGLVRRTKIPDRGSLRARPLRANANTRHSASARSYGGDCPLPAAAAFPVSDVEATRHDRLTGRVVEPTAAAGEIGIRGEIQRERRSECRSTVEGEMEKVSVRRDERTPSVGKDAARTRAEAQADGVAAEMSGGSLAGEIPAALSGWCCSPAPVRRR